MKGKLVNTPLECGCVMRQYSIEDVDNNVCIEVKHIAASAECKAATPHKQRYGIASAWTRRAVKPEKEVKAKPLVVAG